MSNHLPSITYLVAELNDIDKALTETEKEILESLIFKVSTYRRNNAINPYVEYIVTESEGGSLLSRLESAYREGYAKGSECERSGSSLMTFIEYVDCDWLASDTYRSTQR